MKAASTLARVVLGLLFTVFGLNGFLHFIPMGAVSGPAGQYLGALASSHYLSVVFALQLISGLLLLSNRFVPLALTLLAPVIVNILLFHIFLAPAGLPMAIVATLLWIVVAYPVRPTFAVLLQPRATGALKILYRLKREGPCRLEKRNGPESFFWTRGYSSSAN